MINEAFFKEHPGLRGKEVIDLLVDEEDVRIAQDQAKAHGLTRDAYLGQLLHRALQNEKAA